MKRSSIRVPSEGNLEAIAAAGIRLLDAARRYSARRMSGKRMAELPQASWDTFVGLVEAVRSMNRAIDATKLPRNKSDSSVPLVAGWPLVVTREALSWLLSSFHALQVQLGFMTPDGRPIIGRYGNVGDEPRIEDSGHGLYLVTDPQRFTWPAVDSEVLENIGESVATLAALLAEAAPQDQERDESPPDELLAKLTKQQRRMVEFVWGKPAVARHKFEAHVWNGTVRPEKKTVERAVQRCADRLIELKAGYEISINDEFVEFGKLSAK